MIVNGVSSISFVFPLPSLKSSSSSLYIVLRLEAFDFFDRSFTLIHPSSILTHIEGNLLSPSFLSTFESYKRTSPTQTHLDASALSSHSFQPTQTASYRIYFITQLTPILYASGTLIHPSPTFTTPPPIQQSFTSPFSLTTLPNSWDGHPISSPWATV